ENLGITDNTARTATKSLTENVGITDNTARTLTKSLTENLGITDNTTTTTSQTFEQSVNENVGIRDTVTVIVSRTRSLTENLGIVDTMTVSPTKSLQERIGLSTNILFKGGAKIEARDISDSLIGGATYMVSPNPDGSTTPLTVVDGGINDNDSITGSVTFDIVPFGTYNFTMTTIPTGHNVLGNNTLFEVHRTQLNGTAIFRVVLQTVNLSSIAPTVITTAPSLNSTTYDTWTSTYSATVVNETTTHVIDKVQDLPPIVSVGNATSLLNDAITKQASIKLSLSFPALSTGKTIQQTIGVKNYSIPESPHTTSVIPSIVTAPSSSSPQFVMTPPLNKIIPGQMMVMPVEPTLLPSWGGLKQMTVHPMNGKSSVGNAPDDWFVVETSSNVPSAVGTNGITQTNPNLFVDVKYRFEEDGVGFDWSDSDNFAEDPVLKVRVAKSSSVISDSNGCPVMTGYMFDTSSNTWKQQGITLSNIVSIDANTCELDLTVDHFSRFSLFSSPKPSTPSTPSTSTSSGTTSGGAGGGGGGGSGGTAGGEGFGGRLAQPIIIYEITYDVCEQNMVRITVGVVGSESPAPNVKIRTPLKEVYSATLAQNQPYIEANKVLQISRYVYEAPLDPQLNFFIVTAEEIGGRAAVTATYMVDIADDCRRTIVVNPMTDLERTGIEEPTAEIGRPNIFDIKFQVNGNKPIRATEVNHYVESDSKVRVSAIVDSPTSIRRAELRVNIVGGNYSNYAAVKMDAIPLLNITNTYMVSAELPTSFLQAPAIVYWIHVINNDEKIQSSERYALGVKPSYKLDARLELDSPPSKAEGTTYNPTAYVYNNGEKQFFGSVSLLVDGNVVYTSPEQLFNKGQSVVNLYWDIPEVGSESKYVTSARLNMYDTPIETTSTTLQTFPGTKTFSILEPVNASSIISEEEIVARAALLYSSDVNPTAHYRVIAPDGTCVIGKSESCLVKGSTAGNRGNTISVELDGQIYRVRYSGQDSPLERFSITSIDPIVGTWSVLLESDQGIIPEAQALEDVQLKIKYRATYTKLVTVASE
ncbi:MAG TPA: hypothetical protein VNK25_04450, partial [Candidatus Nitrosotenuis sp.]|nr:hypothetical protein [Candidatus Nitrosotenuis sp.]